MEQNTTDHRDCSQTNPSVFTLVLVLITSSLTLSDSDQNHPEWLYHQRLPGEVDPHHQDHHPGLGRVLGPQPGERGPSSARRLLLRQHPVSPLHQVQKE